MSKENISFQERFKGQIQTMGKGGILGTLSDNNSTDQNQPTIIHYGNIDNNLRAIQSKNHQKVNSIPKQTEKIDHLTKQPTSLNDNQSTSNTQINEQQSNYQSNEPIITNPYIQSRINPYMVPNMNMYINTPYSPYLMMNPYSVNPNYNNYNYNMIPQLIYNYIPENNPQVNNQINSNNTTINNNNISNISNINNISKISKPKLRPISSQSRSNNNSRLNNNDISNISNISHNRLNSAHSRSRISTVEYKPYTLKEYKELEKVGIVLGGLGPNIGTKEWEEKKEKMRKMEQYSNKISSLKNKIKKKKEKFEDILEKEKKMKIENSIRSRCNEYANLVRPKPRTANPISKRIHPIHHKPPIISGVKQEKIAIECQPIIRKENARPIQSETFEDISSLGNLNNNNYDTIKNLNIVNYPNPQYNIKDNTNMNDILNDNIKPKEIFDDDEINKILYARENYKKNIDKIKTTL